MNAASRATDNLVESEFPLCSQVVVIFAFCVTLFLFPSKCDCQWRLVLESADLFTCITFLQSEPSIGFAGTEPRGGAFGMIYKSTDGGLSWYTPKVIIPGDEVGLGPVSCIAFKDAKVGWFTTTYTGVYKTSDGGETWYRVVKSGGRAKSVSLTPSGLLYVSTWGWKSLVSSDLGETWQDFNSEYRNGIGFFDDSIGLWSSVSDYPYDNHPWLKTRDGGRTWQPIAFRIETWHPLVLANTAIAYALGDLNNRFFRSTDYGENWREVNSFPYPYPFLSGGSVSIGSQAMYVQVRPGFFKSTDLGETWQNDCGPGNLTDTRFYVDGNFICAASYSSSLPTGKLWINSTGKQIAPSLSLETDGVNHREAGESQDVSIVLPADFQDYDLDSAQCRIAYSAEPLSLTGITPASPWQLARLDTIDGSVTCTFISNGIVQSRAVATLHFKTFVASETRGWVTLSESQIANYHTFEPCRSEVLSQRDTLFVQIEDRCGDSLIRQLVRGVPLRILSIQPNPATSMVTIRTVGGGLGDTYRVIDARGRTLLEGTPTSSTLQLDCSALPSGAYRFELRSGNAVASGNFVVEH